MTKKITLIKLGHAERMVNANNLKKWKSNLFKIIEIHSKKHMPESDVEDGYLDLKYTKEKLRAMISCPNHSDFAVAISPYPLSNNFYMCRISPNCVVISLYGIPETLAKDRISIENFILKQLYEICALSYSCDISTDEVYDLIHPDTRCCLFDRNGDRTHILYNTEKPEICEECKAMFKTKQIDEKIISTLETELKRIKKPFVLSIENHIKKYPLISLLVTGLTAIMLNLLANFIFKLF